MELTAELQRYLEKMPTTDELELIVLKGHLLLEEQLGAVITTIVAHGEFIADVDLTFAQKLTFARAMCWSQHKSNMWPVLESVNRLRADLVHNLEPKKLQKRKTDFATALLTAVDDAKTRAELREDPFHEQFRLGIVYCMGFLGSYLKDAQAYRQVVDAAYEKRGEGGGQENQEQAIPEGTKE